MSAELNPAAVPGEVNATQGLLTETETECTDHAQDDRETTQTRIRNLEEQLAALRRREAARRPSRIAQALADVFETAQDVIAPGSDGKTTPSGIAPCSDSGASSGDCQSLPWYDVDEDARQRVRAELEAVTERPFDSPSKNGYYFGDETLALAHLVDKNILNYFSTRDDTKDFPEVLSATADLLGPYPAAARRKYRAQSKEERAEAALTRTPGAPLLQHSIRNIVRMPKALERSMDSAEWVFEPVLAAECKSGPWAPSMWRFRCLDDSKEIDVSLQSDGRPLQPEPVDDYDGFKGCGATALEGVQHLWPLKNFHGRVFDFDVKDVSIRALVFVYLHNVWQRFELPGQRDRQKLQEGISRVDRWMSDVRTLAGQAAAPSLEYLHKWLDALESRGDELQAAAASVAANPDDGGAAEAPATSLPA